MLQVATDMMHLHRQRVDTYRGNYTKYYNPMTERLKAQQREYESQMDYRSVILVARSENNFTLIVA